MTGDPELASLLVAWRADLLAFVERHAGGLLRFETAEDLVQGIHVRALDRGRDFRYEGEKPFLAWMHTLARGYIVDRRAHWGAMKRGTSRLLRLTASPGTSDPRAAAEPAGTASGASTIASRREQIALAAKALDVLLPRDRDLVRWHADGVAIADQAERLGTTYEAAQRAGHRAVERFRRAYDLLTRPR
jgi:RNA polymerase sigma factor (sigma-70 family)